MGMDQTYAFRASRARRAARRPHRVAPATAAATAASPSTRPSRCAAASSAAPLLAGLLARYPAMSLQVVAKIYAQSLRLKLKGARYFPHPRGAAEGVRLAVRDALARAAVCAVLGRGVRSGRIEVVEGGRSRGFGPADADLRATVTIHDPAAWRGPLHGSVGLGESYVDGLWETDDLVALIRIAARELREPRRPARRRRPPARPPAPAARPRPREHPRRGAREQHLRPLRPRQRPLRRLPRRADDVLLRLLPAPRRQPRGGAAGEARPDLRAAAARPRQPPAGDRHRLGRAGDPRRPRARLPGDDDDDLPRAARAGRPQRVREAGLEDRVTVLLRGLPRPRGTLRPAGLGRDDRGGRLAVLRRLLPPLRRAAQPTTA